MQRYYLCLAMVLLLAGTASADLTVYEYVPVQKVTWDTTYKWYWYWNVADFTNKTYDEQIAAIADLGTYGNIAGGWHMATGREIQLLFRSDHDAATIFSHFNPTWPVVNSFGEIAGRYDRVPHEDAHNFARVWTIDNGETYEITTILSDGDSGLAVLDSNKAWYPLGVLHPLGAWVVASNNPTVIPAPGALVLAAIGLLTYLPGINRLRRQR